MFGMNLGASELILIAGVILLLFGSSRLPKLARAIGESKRALKDGFLKDDGKQSDSNHS